MRKIPFLFVFLICCSCSYKCSLKDEYVHKSINIPYVEGDINGQLTAALIYQVSASGFFEYRQSLSDYKLQVIVNSLTNDKIGFKRDRKHGCNSCDYRKNLMPIENREKISATVSLKSNLTSKVIWGPKVVTADIDYDYSEQDSLKDLSYIDLNGNIQPILAYSLGQLESVFSAQDSALRPLFYRLSKNIVTALMGELEDDY